MKQASEAPQTPNRPKPDSVSAFYNGGDNLWHWSVPMSNGQEYQSKKGYPTQAAAIGAGKFVLETM